MSVLPRTCDAPLQEQEVEGLNNATTSAANEEVERISLANPEQTHHWAQHFGVSVEYLRELIAQVGPRVTDVAARLSAPEARD